MSMAKTVIEFIFSFALFINALLFIPQAIKIFREKTAQGVSFLTFLGFLLIQLAIVLHGVINHDYLLIIGYLFSMATCGLVVVLILSYKNYDRVADGLDLNFKEILEQLPGHIYWKDRGGVTLGCNTNNWKDFGLKSLKEIVGKTDYDLFPKQQADQLRMIDEEVMRTNQFKVIEELLTTGEKTCLYLSYKSPLKNKHDQIIGILGTSVDITSSKQEVMEQFNMLENIIAIMPGNVYWMNKDGVYLGCNDNEAKAVGLKDRQEIIGKRNVDIPGFVIPEFLDEVNKKVMESGNLVVIEEPVVLNDGTKGTFLSSKVPLRNKHGEIIGIVGISIDITDRKRAEVSLKAAKEAAEAANQAKAEFLSNMRHDLRTPFSGLFGLTELIESQETDPEKKATLACVTESAKALLDQINEIFEFVEIERGQLPIIEKEFDLHHLIKNVYDMLLPSAKNKQIDFNLTLDDNLPQYVIGDRVRTERILINVVANAIKFTEKGQIKLAATLIPKLQKEIVVSFLIEDTGIGIPLDKQDIIFERFNRLTSSYSGVYPGKGLGLKIVKQFLDEMGGNAYLTSEVGKGTSLRVLIPYELPLLDFSEKEQLEGFSTKNANQKTVTAGDKNLLHSSSLSTPLSKILVVEDYPIGAKIAKSILLALDCEVDTAETGKAALDLIEKNYYDLIFLDIGLPDMDGYTIAKRIRSHRIASTACTPIVALTAHADSDNKQHCLDVAINAVVTKPLIKEQAETILDTFIPRRKKFLKSSEQMNHTKTNLEQAEKVVDFEYANKLLGGNEAVVREMLIMLMNSLPYEIEALEQVYQQKDWEGLRAVVHKLKGGSSYCGTLRLKSVCIELDNYLKSGLTARIPELYQKLLAEIAALQKFMETQS